MLKPELRVKDSICERQSRGYVHIHACVYICIYVHIKHLDTDVYTCLRQTLGQKETFLVYKDLEGTPAFRYKGTGRLHQGLHLLLVDLF